jgi:hypothetical protein
MDYEYTPLNAAMRYICSTLFQILIARTYRLYCIAGIICIHGITTPVPIAENVVVYIGEENNDSDLAMDSIQHYPCGTDPERTAVKALFSRPWFSRVWVLQEAHFSRSALVICGVLSPKRTR